MLDLGLLWTDQDGFPVDRIDPRLGRIIRHSSEQIGIPCEQIGPVVMAAICAAVQAHVDVLSPYGKNMPTSSYVLIIAKRTRRKSETNLRIMQGFEESDHALRCHSSSTSILYENASEGGLLEAFKNGARSIFFAHDDASKFLRRLDITGACKRFDGTTIRYANREDGSVVLHGRRTSMCLFVQDHAFDRLMKDKGADLIELGLLPRMLISVVTSHTHERLRYTPNALFHESIDEKGFHDRIRSLNDTYRNTLHQDSLKRTLLSLNSEANDAWYRFTNALDESWQTWEDVQPFAGRGGEQVLRLSAALQWFFDPKQQVERWAIDSARLMVAWHLREIKRNFGMPPTQMQMSYHSAVLHDFLARRWQQEYKSEWTRSELLREAPGSLRERNTLSMALAVLLQQGVLYMQKKSRSNIIVFNTLSWHPSAQQFW